MSDLNLKFINLNTTNKLLFYSNQWHKFQNYIFDDLDVLFLTIFNSHEVPKLNIKYANM